MSIQTLEISEIDQVSGGDSLTFIDNGNGTTTRVFSHDNGDGTTTVTFRTFRNIMA